MQSKNKYINYLLIIIILILILVLYNILKNKKFKEQFQSMKFNGIKELKSLINNNIYKNNQGLLINNNNLLYYPISAITNTEINKKVYNNLINILSTIKKELNINNKPFKFNLSNQPLTSYKKNYDDIKYLINIIISLLSKNNIKVINVININENKTEDQVQLKFNLVTEYNNISNIVIDVEILYNKLFSNEDEFNRNEKNKNILTYISIFKHLNI